jgi:phosphoenolpyruvate synthase/pyruvate phosphate dikinase
MFHLLFFGTPLLFSRRDWGWFCIKTKRTQKEVNSINVYNPSAKAAMKNDSPLNIKGKAAFSKPFCKCWRSLLRSG